MPRLVGKAEGKGSGSCQTLQQPWDWCPGFRPSSPTSPLSSGGSPLSTYQPQWSCRTGIGCGLLLCSKPSDSSHLTWNTNASLTSLVKFIGRYFILFCNCIPFASLNLPATTTLPFVYSTPATLASWLSWSTSGHLQPQGLCTAISSAWFKPQLSYFFTMSLFEPHIFLL